MKLPPPPRAAICYTWMSIEYQWTQISRLRDFPHLQAPPLRSPAQTGCGWRGWCRCHAKMHLEETTAKIHGYPLKKTLKNNPCLCLQLDSMTPWLIHFWDPGPREMVPRRVCSTGPKWTHGGCPAIKYQKKQISYEICLFFFFGFWFSLSCISFLTHESASTTKHSRPSEPADKTISCKCKTWNALKIWSQAAWSKAHAKKRFVIFGQFHLSLMSHLCLLLNQLNRLFFFDRKIGKIMWNPMHLHIALRRSIFRVFHLIPWS